MKKFLKSKICGSVNCALFTKKSNISTKKKKNQNKRNAKRAFGKRANTL